VQIYNSYEIAGGQYPSAVNTLSWRVENQDLDPFSESEKDVCSVRAGLDISVKSKHLLIEHCKGYLSC